MGTRDARVDAYISKSADFAKPILTHLRELIHQACPSIEETMKWSFPHFMYKGERDRQSRILCSMASFKQHCAFGFWHPEMRGRQGDQTEQAMGQLGRIASLSNLPKDKTLIGDVKEAMRLHDSGARPKPTARPRGEKTLNVPDYLMAALKKNKKALSTFESFNYSNKKEYVDWLMEAKTGETRSKRLATAVDWMSEGKTRNWKYVRR
ncbi:MAG TPA: YdeI/OmpD-associated family protein [Blastocatellia bacterium]|jgi:uncharacterized protein YdeI (YjbR/CyaY-like superfamily)